MVAPGINSAQTSFPASCNFLSKHESTPNLVLMGELLLLEVDCFSENEFSPLKNTELRKTLKDDPTVSIHV